MPDIKSSQKNSNITNDCNQEKPKGNFSLHCQNQTNDSNCNFVGKRVDNFSEFTDFIQLPRKVPIEQIRQSSEHNESGSDHPICRLVQKNSNRNDKENAEKTQSIRDRPDTLIHEQLYFVFFFQCGTVNQRGILSAKASGTVRLTVFMRNRFQH